MAARRTKIRPQYILDARGQWVGPPVLILQLSHGAPTVLDGRRRRKEHAARGLRTPVPELVVTSHLQAVAQLVAAGHNDRAITHAFEHAPHLAQTTAHHLERITGVATTKWGVFLGAMRNGGPLHKRRARTAMGVVRRGLELREAIRDGHQPTLADIEFVLGDFLK